MASGETEATAVPWDAFAFSRKRFTSAGTSEARSRSGGRSTGITLRR